MDDDAVMENNEQDGNESDKDDEADKSSSDEEVTSIHDCVRREDVEDLEKLLADPAKKKEINKIKKIYGEQLTPLELAVQGDSLEIVKLLVKNGAGSLGGRMIMKERFDVKDHHSVPDTRDPLTLLELAAATEERAGMIEFLLAAGADMNARDKDNKTPLCWAVLEGKDKNAQTLLRHDGLDKKVFKERYNDTYEKPMTLLEHAISKCTFDTVKMLVDKGAGAKVDEPNSDRNTPIHLAAEESQSEVLQLLLKRPVRDINAVNDKQETALHKAAGSGDKKCVELLLKK
nr:hypothetical protein BaRGS_027134 [Batillaria attramentaria]